MTITRRAAIAALPAIAAMPCAPSAQPAWPERPVRVIVPFPPGSTPDIAARAVAAHLQIALGQPFVPENRAGAGGNIGTDVVAKATDGHTIGVSINGPLTTAPALNANLPYNPQRNLAPVSLLMRGAQLVLVHPDVPARDFSAFIAYARANPGRMSFGSVGAGSGGHLAMSDIMARAGIELVHVPYRGFPEATLDLVAGRIQAMVVIAAGVLPQVREGRVRALAVTADARIPQAPEVPTLAEAGMPDAASYAWIGLIAPAATPADRIARLSAEAQRALTDPQTKARMEAVGFEVVASSPEQFAAFMARESERWGGMIRRLGIRADG